MKIALLTDGIYPYVLGGMQKHSYYLVKYFAQNKVFVDLYHMPQNKEYDINELDLFSNEEKKYIKSIVITFPILKKLPGHYVRESYLYSEKIFEALQTNLKDIDFIYAKGFCAWKLLKEKKKGFICPPIGVKFHGLEMFQKAPSFRTRLEYSILRAPALYNMTNADFVFSYGGKITDLKLKLKISREKIIEIPSGIENSWLSEGPFHVNAIKKFLFIGRYERRKGIEELTKVLNNILANENFEFHFIGPIPESKHIISDKIKYWGRLTDQNSIKKIAGQCDVLVCPSHSEGMPNVILEGMALGLSVIATDVGAVNCMVTPENGWLIAAGNQDQLLRAMQEAIHLDNETLHKKKISGQTFIKDHFLWKNIIQETISKIRNIINQRKES